MVEQQIEVRIELSAPEGPVCAHHWQIETPNGETSDACCKFCGATRSFANYSHRRPMTRSVRPPAEPTTRF